MSDHDADGPVLVEVVRGRLVESVHRARVAITRPDGDLVCALGSVCVPVYPRSAVKPLQAVGMLRAGLDVEQELLALVASSHSGEDFHITGVSRILADVGLDQSALQTPPSYPLDAEAMISWIQAGRGKEPIAMNCSGKHAGMINTAVRAGSSIEQYRDPDHPVQQAVTQAISDGTQQRATAVTVDGCGAPLYAIDLAGLARAFGQLAGARDDTSATVANAIRAYPEYTSGTRRDEAELHRAIPGLVTKGGAEAVQAIGLPDGHGVAIKVDDGGSRARPVLAAAILQQLGYDHPTLTEHTAPLCSATASASARSVRFDPSCTRSVEPVSFDRDMFDRDMFDRDMFDRNHVRPGHDRRHRRGCEHRRASRAGCIPAGT